MFTNNQALVVVDVQNDFCEGGALAVNDTLTLIKNLNPIIKDAYNNNLLVIFTKDYHPSNHISFKENGGLWPRHCVALEEGSSLHKDLYLPNIYTVIHKGVDANLEGYSAFENTNFYEFLIKNNIKNILITGIASEYCVFETSNDSTKLGFNTVIIKSLTRAVNQSEKFLSKVWQDLNNQGVITI